MSKRSNKSINLSLPSFEAVDQLVNEFGITTPMGLKRSMEGMQREIVNLNDRVTLLEKENREIKRKLTQKKSSKSLKPRKPLV